MSMRLTEAQWATLRECVEYKASEVEDDPDEFAEGALDHMGEIIAALPAKTSAKSPIFLEGAY